MTRDKLTSRAGHVSPPPPPFEVVVACDNVRDSNSNVGYHQITGGDSLGATLLVITLILSVSPIVVDISPDILNIRNNRHAQALVNIFLTGDSRLSTEANKVIFSHVFEYIIATKRFR